MNYFYKYSSPIGSLFLYEEDQKLVKIGFNKATKEKFIDNEYLLKMTDLLKQACNELDEYFKGKRLSFNIPLNLKGTSFQKKVWKALQNIPYGNTTSYKEIAEIVGSPKGYRAVGNANNKNPIPIMIPCHRIIGSSGGLVGYAGGLSKKKKLLSLEEPLKR